MTINFIELLPIIIVSSIGWGIMAWIFCRKLTKVSKQITELIKKLNKGIP